MNHQFLLLVAAVIVSAVTASPLDTTVSSAALAALSSSTRSGIPRPVPLPTSTPHGLIATVVRLRTGSIYLRGANLTHFSIPPRTTVHPYTTRLALVSVSNYPTDPYDIPRFSILTPVFGLFAYDIPSSSSSSSPNLTRQLSLIATGDEPIRVQFVSVPTRNVTLMCVRYTPEGQRIFSDLHLPDTCTARGDGRFTIVMAEEEREVGEEGGHDGGVEKAWVMQWSVALVVVSGVGAGTVCAVRVIRRRRREEMERQSAEEEMLRSVRVGSSRLPVAGSTRTRPTLEIGGATSM